MSVSTANRNQITKSERTRRSAQAWGVAPGASTSASPVEELILPSGFVVDVRRPSLTVWLMNGRVPETFLLAAMDKDGGSADPTANLEGDDLIKALSFIRDVVVETCVAPRIVVGAAAGSEDEIDPARIPEADFFAIFTYAMNAPVATTDGKRLSVGALNNFPQKQNIRSGRKRR